MYLGVFHRNVYFRRKLRVYLNRTSHPIFIQTAILLHVRLLCKKVAIISRDGIDIISAIHIAISTVASTNRAAGSKRESSREREKAKRIDEGGNFSRKLRRTSDNGGRERREGWHSEKRSAIYGHPSMSRVTARESSQLYTTEGVASVRIAKLRGMLVPRDPFPVCLPFYFFFFRTLAPILTTTVKFIAVVRHEVSESSFSSFSFSFSHSFLLRVPRP